MSFSPARGQLTYYFCRSCLRFLLVCDEERITFDDPTLMDQMHGRDFKGGCTSCEGKGTLRPATGEEYQKLGFKPGEYH